MSDSPVGFIFHFAVERRAGRFASIIADLTLRFIADFAN
jgi:hypothetical protein